MIKAQSLRAFEETFRVTARQSEAASKRALVETAEHVRDDVIARQRSRAGVTPDYETVVDRVRGAPINAVRHDGVIVFEWIYLREVADQAFELLVARGPERTGAWKRSIAVFVDDTRASLGAITPATRLIEIAPTMPYSRRLEIGRDRQGGPFIVQAPMNLVQDTMRVLRTTYRNVARLGFTYVQMESDATRGLRGRRRQRERAALRFPAISIEPVRS